MPKSEPESDETGPGRPGPRPGQLSALLQDLIRAPPGERGDGWSNALVPGAVVARFELVREIGRGGFGVVWEAKDRELGRAVAFKAIQAAGSPDLSEERLLREAESAARLSHPNIVTLFDLGRTDNGPYLVLELLRGRTLADRLALGRISLREALHVTTEVAKGVAHAHAKGVVHRDLKPANVFLCDDGQVKVLDFGMAHAFGRRRLEGGTPAYMAPEQWEGAPEDERTDVFALGVMLYRLIGRELPFPDDAGRSVQGPGPAPMLDVPEIPGVGDLVARMLEKRPVLRPRDGSEVVAALRALLVELERNPSAGATPVTTRPRSGLPGLVSELKRRRVVPAFVGYATFAVVAVKGLDSLSEKGRLPGWGLTAGLALLGLGFPATLLVAWFYDLTGQGIRRTARDTPAGSPPRSKARLVPLLVAVVLLAVVPALVYHLAFRGRGAVPETAPAVPAASVAVLPFADLSPGHDQEYLSDGIAEEILRTLASVPGLKVPGRASSVWFKGKNLELQEIARKLGVAHLLTGSVRHSGTRVRVTSELTRAADGERVWTQAYERELSDVFAIEDDVARSVVQAIAPVLLANRHAGRYPRTTDPEAFRLMLLGRYLNAQGSSESHRRAAEALRRAVAIDPSYAPAQAFLYFASANLSMFTRGQERERLIAESRRAADAAVVADSSFAIGRVVRGLARVRYDLDWTGAQTDVETAARLAPQDETVLNARALLLVWMGRIDEAAEVQRKAVAADPLDAIHLENLSMILIAQGRYDEARECSRRVREISGDGSTSAYLDGWVALRTGEPAIALTAFEQSPEPFRSPGIVAALHALGRDAEARAALSRLEREFTGDLITIAGARAWSGDPDGAFAALDEAVRMRVLGRASVKANLWLLPLRGDARFTELLRRLGFPDKPDGG